MKLSIFSHQPRESKITAQSFRMGCACLVFLLSLVFLSLGGLLMRASALRNPNEPIDWPECEPLPHGQTFEQCRDIFTTWYTGGFITGVVLFSASLLIVLFELALCCVESSQIDEQAVGLASVRMDYDDENNYGTFP